MSLQVFHCFLFGWLCVNSNFQILLITVGLCCFICFNATHGGGSTSLKVTHCLSLGWLCVVPFLFWSPALLCIVLGVQQLFTKVALHFLTCPTASYLGGFVSPRCSTATHWNVSEKFQVSHCHLLGLLSVIYLYFCCSQGWFSVFPGVSALLPEVGGHHSRYTNAASWCEFALFTFFLCPSLRWIVFPLTWVALCGFICSLFWWLCVILGVPLMLIEIAVPFLRCTTADFKGESLSYQMSHDSSWLAACCSTCCNFAHWGDYAISLIPLLLTRVAH